MSASLTANTARLGAIARRDWRTVKRYQFRQMLRLLDFVYAAILAFYVGRLFDTVPDELTQYGGNYFDFAMVGLAVMSVAGLGIGTFNDTITREQTLGTLEVLLVTPTPVPVLLAGSLVLPLALTFIDIALYVGVGIGVFGIGLTLSGVLLAFPLFLLTLASFCAFGIVGASIAVLAKRGDPLSGPLIQATAVLSGALFPVSVFPPVLELLARCFPAYYGINGLREALLGGGSWSDIAPDVAVLAGFVVVLLPLSVWIFEPRPGRIATRRHPRQLLIRVAAVERFDDLIEERSRHVEPSCRVGIVVQRPGGQPAQRGGDREQLAHPAPVGRQRERREQRLHQRRTGLDPLHVPGPGGVLDEEHRTHPSGHRRSGERSSGTRTRLRASLGITTRPRRRASGRRADQVTRDVERLGQSPCHELIAAVDRRGTSGHR